MASRPTKKKPAPRPTGRKTKARRAAPKRAAAHRRRAKVPPVSAAAASPANGNLPAEVQIETIVHALGRLADRNLCGAVADGSPPSPAIAAWGTLAERSAGLAQIEQALEAAKASLPGEVRLCKGCLSNLGKMKAADDTRHAAPKVARVPSGLAKAENEQGGHDEGDEEE